MSHKKMRILTVTVTARFSQRKSDARKCWGCTCKGDDAMEKEMHIDGKNYEVVSVLPLTDTENPPETAADKLKYLIQESKS